MRLVLTLLVRDELDILPSTLDYHLAQGIDHVIVTDNGSRDGTRERLAEYEARGRVTVLDEAPSDFSQHRWVTRMARLAATRFGADWVLNGDADELFLWRPGTLRDGLQRIPAAVSRLVLRRHDFVACERRCALPPPAEMIYRKAASTNAAGEPLPPKMVHRGAADVVVCQGNHGASSGTFTGDAVEGEIEVFHYPVRTFAQFESKVRNGGSGYARNAELAEPIGFHKRRWYAQLLEGTLDREYHARLYYDPARLVETLESGELVVDPTAARRIAAAGALSGGAAASAR
jgi:glycosyltransferase involved in cell wall biosynthesis